MKTRGMVLVRWQQVVGLSSEINFFKKKKNNNKIGVEATYQSTLSNQQKG